MTILARHKVGRKRGAGTPSVTITGAPLESIGVGSDDRVKILNAESGVLVVPASQRPSMPVLTDYSVHVTRGKPHVHMFSPALEPLGVAPGDVVELHARPVGFEMKRGDSS